MIRMKSSLLESLVILKRGITTMLQKPKILSNFVFRPPHVPSLYCHAYQLLFSGIKVKMTIIFEIDLMTFMMLNQSYLLFLALVYGWI